MSVRTIITIGSTAERALERFEAAESALAALKAPGIWATDADNAVFEAARKPLIDERNDAANLLASMVGIAMRTALEERKERAA